MHILVLGATSQIGSALAQEFSPGNSMFLVGRSDNKLGAAKSACESARAKRVMSIELDLSHGLEPLRQVLQDVSIDLVIDAASASSATRDAEIDPGDMGRLLSADFTSRTEIFGRILARQESLPAVIYVSTILTLVRSPGRVVYTSLKALYEVYLRKLKAGRPDFRLLVVYVGTVIDPKKASAKPQKLAAAVVRAFHAKSDTLNYGLSGRLFVGLFYLQPLVFSLVARVQRNIRALRTPRL